jgi:hypothetical protein
MPVRPRHVVVGLVAACIVVSSVDLAVAAPSGVDRGAALADLNAMRSAAGLRPVVRFERRWNRGCRLHNRYMSATGDFGHGENSGSDFYSRLGSDTAASSVIAEPMAVPSVAWGDTVYHRLALLQPRLRHSGFDASYGFTCMQVIDGVTGPRKRGLALYPWPPNGATGIPPGFDGGEAPNPLDLTGGRMGTPLTVAVNGPWRRWYAPRSRVTAATLIPDAGAPPTLVMADDSSAHRDYLQGGFGILPQTALQPATWYTAHVTGVVAAAGRHHGFDLSWRFQTAP